MSAPVRLVGFAAVLGLAFGAAMLAGAAIDPTGDEAVVADRHGDEHGGESVTPASADEGGHGADGGGPVSGLAVQEGGYSLETDRRFFPAGEVTPFTFRITGDHGRVVHDEYELEHDKELHLIVVRRDTAIFEHVHPTKGEDGTWSVDLSLRDPGVYRAYADFKIGGEKRTLATDLFVPGEFRPKPLPAPAPTAQPVDTSGEVAPELEVRLVTPSVGAGDETSLTFEVTRNGQPFEALEPYLGARGHLVALREGDLAYLHVHPAEGGAEHEDGSPPADTHGDQIQFVATFPTVGRYRLFLQFKTGGEILTVAYTVEVR